MFVQTQETEEVSNKVKQLLLQSESQQYFFVMMFQTPPSSKNDQARL